MQHRHGLIAVLILVLVGLATPAAATANWSLLGERVVNDRAERDTIFVGAQEGRLTGLKLAAAGAPVELKRVDIHFGNGEIQTIRRNRWIGQGHSSPTLNLAGGRRVVKKVVFVYQARSPGRERALVHLYGRH